MGSVVAQLELKCQRGAVPLKTWGRPREIDRTAILEDLEGGMSVMKVAAKHGIGRATVFRSKVEAKES